MNQPNDQDDGLKQNLKQLVSALPPVIRDFVTREKYAPVAKALMVKYGLRIDQGGILEQEMLLLLLGVETPTDFLGALRTEAGIPEGAVRSIMADVNTQIFVPLQKEMQAAALAGRVTPPPGEQAYRPPAPRAPQPVATPPAPAAPSASGSLGSVLRSVAPQAVPSAPATQQAPVRPPVPPQKPPTTAGEAVHEAVAPLPPKVALPQSGKVPPANPSLLNRRAGHPVNLLAKQPYRTDAPANLPTGSAPFPPPRAPEPPRPPAPPAPPMSPVSTAPAPAVPPVPPSPRPAQPPAKLYDTDPYREPIE